MRVVAFDLSPEKPKPRKTEIAKVAPVKKAAPKKVEEALYDPFKKETAGTIGTRLGSLADAGHFNKYEVLADNGVTITASDGRTTITLHRAHVTDGKKVIPTLCSPEHRLSFPVFNQENIVVQKETA